MSVKQNSQIDTPNLDAILSSHVSKRAELITAVGRWSTFAVNAGSSYGFGYLFVPMSTTGLSVGSLSVDGIVGGLACVGLTDVASRIWDVTRSQSAQAPTQQGVARAGYSVSFVASILMTIIYLGVMLFGSADATRDGFVVVGQVVVALLTVFHLVMYALYDQNSPLYIERLIRTTSQSAVRAQVLEMESTALLKTATLVRDKLGTYAEPHAEQIAKDIVVGALAQLGYEPERLVNLPSHILASTTPVESVDDIDGEPIDVDDSVNPFRIRRDGQPPVMTLDELVDTMVDERVKAERENDGRGADFLSGSDRPSVDDLMG